MPSNGQITRRTSPPLVQVSRGYRAEDPKHHPEVAVKVLRPELAAALWPKRFLREIEIADAIN